MPTRVLVVDDEDDVRMLTGELLRRAGYEVLEATDGREGLQRLYDQGAELVLLDVAMPRLDGWQTLERIREVSDVPVIMCTARDLEDEKVRGLRAGADDYVTKPFGGQELVARVEAALRRHEASQPEDGGDVYRDGLLRVDFPRREVHAAGQQVSLTPQEFRLLSAFVRHPDQVLEHDQLLGLAWGADRATSRDQVKLYVGYLRRKFAAAGVDLPLESVRGFGYRYRPPKPA